MVGVGGGRRDRPGGCLLLLLLLLWTPRGVSSHAQPSTRSHSPSPKPLSPCPPPPHTQCCHPLTAAWVS